MHASQTIHGSKFCGIFSFKHNLLHPCCSSKIEAYDSLSWPSLLTKERTETADSDSATFCDLNYAPFNHVRFILHYLSTVFMQDYIQYNMTYDGILRYIYMYIHINYIHIIYNRIYIINDYPHTFHTCEKH